MLRSLSTVLAAAVAFVLNPTNAAALRHMIEESSESRDDITRLIGATYDSLYSTIDSDSDNSDVLDNFISLMESLSPMSSQKGCDHVKTSSELSALITSNAGGEVNLCSGIVDFTTEIALPASNNIVISCAGPDGSCIFDGNGNTRHFFSSSNGVNYTFIGITFINGFADNNNNNNGPFGGSVRFSQGPYSIFTRCLFYNNHATSSTDFVVSNM